MALTTEQQSILSHVVSTPDLTLVDACAGSGKTTLLVAIANAIPHTNGVYLCYNKSVSVEAQRKFPNTTHCVTTHSMAYAATVKTLKLKLGEFSYRNITERLLQDQKYSITQHIRSFCLSKYTSFADYALEFNVPPLYVTIVNKYLNLMQSATIECTHDFYLKLFHMMLANNSLTYDPFDFIMLDEAGDLNEVTLEIFKLLPSIRKVAVGDKHQNIYQFNDTINCFKVLEGQGTLLPMTKSFRVSKAIASKVEAFGRRYLDPLMSFEGTNSLSPAINTRAYITRTNSALIQKMIHLNSQGTAYSLNRSAKDIFKVPLMLCNIKYQGFITDPTYKFLQADIDNWYESDSLRTEYPSIFSYIAHECPEDVQLAQAIRLIQTHKKTLIISTFEEARLHEKSKHQLTLATVHSCKGSEYDEVTLADDLHEVTAVALDRIDGGSVASPKDLETINLYWVACTRAAKALNNARHL